MFRWRADTMPNVVIIAILRPCECQVIDTRIEQLTYESSRPAFREIIKGNWRN